MAGDALSGRPEGSADDVQIVVSPHTLVLSSAGGCVSVHTNRPLGIVDCSTLELDGIPVAYVKADARGNLVANFGLDAVKAIVAPPEATLTLTGALRDGRAFAASDTIRVKE